MISAKHKSEDLRIKKTYKALIDAIHALLVTKNFNQITVNDICSEALVSRATFYIHFTDKYDLLEYLLSSLNSYFTGNLDDYETLEKNVNQLIEDNKLLISNIFIEANAETLELINSFVEKIIKDVIAKRGNSKNQNIETLTDFCSGGIIKIFCLQVKNNFSKGCFMTPYLYEMIKMIINPSNTKK